MSKIVTATTFKENIRNAFNLFYIKNLTFDDHLRLYLWLLRTFGLGFLDDDYYMSIYPFYGTFTVILVVYICISDVVFIKNNINDVSKTTECLTTLLLATAMLLKIGVLCYFRQELRNLIDDMRNVYNFAKSSSEEEWKIMLKRVQEARIMTRLFYFVTIAVTVTFICCTLPQYKSRALPVPAKGVGIEGDDIISYAINFMIQVWSMIFVTHVMPGYESVLLYALLIQCGHLEILAYRLENIGRGNKFYGKIDDDDSIDWENGKFADNMNTIYKIDCLCEILLSTLVGCVALYQITEGTNENVIAFYFFLACCTLQILAYCWYGDLLKEKSLEICAAIGKSPWYLLHPSQRKDLQLMLLKAQTPITLSALFADLTLECFTTIMKSTYSYYTVLTSSEN